jgi:Tfp pilus assembly protein PilO
MTGPSLTDLDNSNVSAIDKISLLVFVFIITSIIAIMRWSVKLKIKKAEIVTGKYANKISWLVIPFNRVHANCANFWNSHELH